MLTIFPKFARMEKLNQFILLVLLLHTSVVSAVDISSLVFFDLNGSTQEAINPVFSVRRAYLDLREQLTDNISFRLTTDSQSSNDVAVYGTTISSAGTNFETALCIISS